MCNIVTLNYKQAPSCLFALNSAYSIIQEKLYLKFIMCPLSFFLSYCHVIRHLSGKRPIHNSYDIIWHFHNLAKLNIIFGKKIIDLENANVKVRIVDFKGALFTIKCFLYVKK